MDEMETVQCENCGMEYQQNTAIRFTFPHCFKRNDSPTSPSSQGGNEKNV